MTELKYKSGVLAGAVIHLAVYNITGEDLITYALRLYIKPETRR